MENNLNEIRDYVEKVIESFLPEEEGHAKPVIEAMNYAVQGGGKRIRPLLMYLTYMAFGAENSNSTFDGPSGVQMAEKSGDVEMVVEPVMAALEMIHCYSLVHDDILDNDDLRRGKPSCHKQYGKDMALLAGDGLLNYAYETAAKAFTLKPGDMNVEKAYAVFTCKPGLYGMLGGQTADVFLTGKPISAEQLDYIYRNKTSALIECALMIGAILAGMDSDRVLLLEEVGYKVGMAFQVRDDILDIEGDEIVLGKSVGQDMDNNKYTYARIHGLADSKKYVEDITKDAIAILNKVKEESSFVNEDYFNLLLEMLSSLANRTM